MSFLKPNRASQPAGRTTDRSLLLTPTKTIRNDKKLGEREKTWNGNAGSTKVTCILFESRFMLSRVTLFYSLFTFFIDFMVFDGFRSGRFDNKANRDEIQEI